MADSTTTSIKRFDNPKNPDGTTLGQTSADPISFHGATPVAQQTVTGSRGGNAALASLLTALETLGIIVDSSS